MQQGARIFETLHLWSTYDYSRPADDYLHFALRQKRYIGGSDRRAIRGLFYAMIRHQIILEEKLETVLIQTKKHPKDTFERHRWMMLIYFQEKGYTDYLNSFNGQVHHPKKISDVEGTILSHCPIVTLKDASALNLTPFWYKKLKAQFGGSLAELMISLNDEAPLDVRVNTLKLTRDEAIKHLKRHNISCELLLYAPTGLRIQDKQIFPGEFIQQGLFEPQDEGSQLITLVCNVKPGMRVVDFCAGAGGKTLGLAMQMENKGQIIASDISKVRLDRARERLRRLDLHNVIIKMIDTQWLKRHGGEFDRVLVDAPCSGSGTWRRNPELKVRVGAKDLNELVQKQRHILSQASRLVKRGGSLIYATCSLLDDENNDQIQWFLKSHPDFVLVDLSTRHSLDTSPCHTPTWSLTPLLHKTDGFFVGCVERKA